MVNSTTFITLRDTPKLYIILTQLNYYYYYYNYYDGWDVGGAVLQGRDVGGAELQGRDVGGATYKTLICKTTQNYSFNQPTCIVRLPHTTPTSGWSSSLTSFYKNSNALLILKNIGGGETGSVYILSYEVKYMLTLVSRRFAVLGEVSLYMLTPKSLSVLLPVLKVTFLNTLPHQHICEASVCTMYL